MLAGDAIEHETTLGDAEPLPDRLDAADRYVAAPPPPPNVPAIPWRWEDGPDAALTLVLLAMAALCMALTLRVMKEGLTA